MIGNKKVVVLFPGIGYHCDKPLLYYSKKVALQMGYSVIEVDYSKPLKEAGADKGDLNLAFNQGLEYAKTMLEKIDWRSYNERVFISKSIGTVIARAFDDACHVNARHIMFTPLEQTFLFNIENSIMFHGTGDPMVKTSYVQQRCKSRNIPLNIVPGANHSLERGSIEEDLYILKNVMLDVKNFL